jgi:hypothetical protein
MDAWPPLVFPTLGLELQLADTEPLEYQPIRNHPIGLMSSIRRPLCNHIGQH